MKTMLIASEGAVSPATTGNYHRMHRIASENAVLHFVNKDRRIQLPGNGRLVSDFAHEVGCALKHADIFTRNGTAFTINSRGDGLEPFTPQMLRTWVEDYFCCFKLLKHDAASPSIELKRTMTESDAQALLASRQFHLQLNEVERFNCIPMPVMRQSGRIELLPSGYDPETKTFTAQGNVLIVPKLPVAEARRIIDELLSEFVFADKGRSKAVAVASMLTIFGYGLLPRKTLRPCFVFLANAEGAGKSLLVKCATVPVLGTAPNGTKPKDEDEMRKVLHTAVLEAKSVLIFDNIKRRLDSESLEGFLTSQDWTGRTLGISRTFTGENNVTVFITGNGCTVSADMRRRSLFCELFLAVERVASDN